MSKLSNTQIADALDELAQLYELDGAVSHRVMAYRRAADTVRDTAVSVSELAEDGSLTSLEGIGSTLAEKIEALVKEGSIPASRELLAKIPAGLLDVVRVPGVGPKKARALFDQLGVDSTESLAQAAEAEQIQQLKGFGSKSEATILEGLKQLEEVGERSQRVVLNRALLLATPLVEEIKSSGLCREFQYTGDVRRWADSVECIEAVAVIDDLPALLEYLTTHALVEAASQEDSGRLLTRTHTGIEVLIRAAKEQDLGSILQVSTGPEVHNQQLKELANKRQISFTKDGLQADQGGYASEQELYEALGCQQIPPELRGSREALELALAGSLPQLIEVSDLKGDLHSHTLASDGRVGIEEMAQAAVSRGLQYLAVTDHSASHGFGNAVSPSQLVKQIDAVREIDARRSDIDLLVGSEVNILPDGTLDYDDDLLSQLDWVIASVHSSFAMDVDRMTERICHAIRHPSVNAIGHPTGRLVERRLPYRVDVDEVVATCLEHGKMLEINANPKRRDLNVEHAKLAAKQGVKLLINCDAHAPEHFGFASFGVATARSAGLTKESIANTLPLAKFKELLTKSS